MLAHATTHLKCEILRVSSFHHFPTAHLFIDRTLSSSRVPAFTITSHLNRPSYRFRMMSSQVMEQMQSNVVVKEHSEDLPLTSSYESAMEALSSLIISKRRGDGSSVGGKYEKLERMTMYLKILDLEKDIGGLRIIHVAGTKGKGSTCTFCEAILRQCGFRTGLFTSPHLIDVRERFRINGLEISEDKFLQYFWNCWYQLEEKITEDLPMPPFFQFLILLAFKVFICEQVDVVIVEVGLGGKRDSTNVIKEPIVCGITSLGMDHMEALGNTLGQIAFHKAGILKPHVPAFVAPQLSEAMDVIQEVARGLMVPLEVVAPLDCKQMDGKLSLAGDHQFINAGLAVSLSKCWLQRTGNWEKLFGRQDILEDKLPEAFCRGLSTAYLSGRAEIVYDTSSKSFSSSKVSECSSGDLVFYLDGAHSPESMEVCGRWFSTAIKANEKTSSCSRVKDREQVWSNGHVQHGTEEMVESTTISKQILLFNCMEVRDPQVLLPRLVSTCASSGSHFSKALFVPGMSTHNKVTSAASAIPADSFSRDLAWQFDLQRLWEKLMHGKEVDDVIDMESKMDAAAILPHEFLYEDASNCSPVGNHFTCSAVIPSLPLAINWLRDCVKANPAVRIQVLVTGSLHLVGDVLKLLRK
ncbi:putative tetrahydrofolate synthase [Rosa chinensis]|uniref:Folylpolyglutamate synthase n=1 Tax=Rosa chinensis TaxID=74649 RepID=A0A2P6RER8_ROSCH|nr:folylpolyglutamate synthase isoform X1 [Rosa chinensis]XP_040373090.1 folylpolyglutamate synthase isoform X1 [Rosa chinensis]PRQ44926.1 putative tetrahydrofolate synthase [Rosa chinensis]